VFPTRELLLYRCCRRRCHAISVGRAFLFVLQSGRFDAGTASRGASRRGQCRESAHLKLSKRWPWTKTRRNGYAYQSCMHVLVGLELRFDGIEHHGQHRGGRRVNRVAVGRSRLLDLPHGTRRRARARSRNKHRSSRMQNWGDASSVLSFLYVAPFRSKDTGRI
jgi:hypothetical protein